MKKHYTLILIAFIATSSIIAQSFVYSPSQDVVETIQMSNFYQSQVDMTTPNPEAIQFKFQMISNTFPTGWVYTFCVHTACYSGLPASGTMTPISLTAAQNGQQGYFKLIVTAGQNYGQGVLKYYVYDANDINRGDTVSWNLDWPQPLGIDQETNASVFSFYPNPAKNNITLNNSSNSNLNVEIYNLLGEIVAKEVILSNQTNNLSLTKLNRGVYFISLTNSAGIKQTQRLIIE